MNDESEGAALLAAINENPNDLAPRLIYSDWLEENSRFAESGWWRGAEVASLPIADLFRAEESDGGGFGDGNGDQGLTGIVAGAGYGDGFGPNSGDGSEGGFGDGTNRAFGEGFWHITEPNDDFEIGFIEDQRSSRWLRDNQPLIEGRPVIGKQMLIWCGRGFAWIGHVDEMYAPGCYKLSNAGMLCRTGADSWMAVASGAARDNYVYRHAPDGIVYTGPELHGAVEWKGELPGRDMR